MRREPIEMIARARELEQMIPPRMHHLLKLLFWRFRVWRPKVGFPSASAGFATGGSVSEFEDLEEEADGYAVSVIESAYDQLTCGQREVIRLVVDGPTVWTVREGVLREAIESIALAMRRGGV